MILGRTPVRLLDDAGPRPTIAVMVRQW